MRRKHRSVSRREFFKAAGMTGVAVAASPLARPSEARAAAADGTPEQIHLTWGADPSRTVVVSWATPTQAGRGLTLLGRLS